MAKKYIITSAVPGADLNDKFYKSIQTYCKKNKAKLLIIPTLPMSRKDILDIDVPEECLVTKNLPLNSKIRISNIHIRPTQIDPVSGLQRNSQTDGSFIFASPKQRLKFVPNSNTKYPHALMTTGAITLPTNYKQDRAGQIAEMDHVNGALIVEIVDNNMYHFRQVQADDKDGSFIDLGVQYLSTGKMRKAEVEAVVFGDWHSLQTDPVVRRVSLKMIERFKPERTIVHDGLDFYSRNHHHKGKNILNARKADLCNVDKELNIFALDMKEIAKRSKSVVVVKSNHDEALDRWLESGAYVEDDRNFEIGHQLALIALKGRDPLEHYVRSKTSVPNVRFLKRDEDLKLSSRKIQCGSHGDIGSNGARGSTAAIELAYARSISGHSHTPEILRGAFVVGTSSYLKLEYNRGPSSWMNTHCILYRNGSRQLLNIIDGNYHA